MARGSCETNYRKMSIVRLSSVEDQDSKAWHVLGRSRLNTPPRDILIARFQSRCYPALPSVTAEIRALLAIFAPTKLVKETRRQNS